MARDRQKEGLAEVCFKYKNKKLQDIISGGIWIKLQPYSTRERGNKKPFIRTTDKSGSV